VKLNDISRGGETIEDTVYPKVRVGFLRKAKNRSSSGIRMVNIPLKVGAEDGRRGDEHRKIVRKAGSKTQSWSSSGGEEKV